MKRIAIFTVSVLLAVSAMGQQYSFTFKVAGATDTMAYLAQHYRDEFVKLDSTRLVAGQYVFKGKKSLPRGIYALLRQDGKTLLTDFLVDDSRTFTISGDANLTPSSIKVKGSAANQLMFDYTAKQQWARNRADSLQKAKDDAGMEALSTVMDAYQKETDVKGKDNLYLQLVKLCEPPTVDDSVADKPLYYRMHYWDPLFNTQAGALSLKSLHSELLRSPQLFSKMNFFFFGLLYRADADTIMKELDRLMARIGDDTALARYVMQFVEPRYYRSTRNIGWDAVWCHIASEYILKGRCPWMRESEVYLARQNYGRISKSIIGAHGQELWMLDTTQIDSPEHWHSSHRQPTKYVILWFWDPDCHHCQEQSAELKVLYDSLLTAPNRPFEVYAIGYDSDVPKWKRYVKTHGFNWINVGGPNVNVDYQEAYNVHGAPTMVILDENRDIIMNKVLPIKSLMKFLEEYDKRGK